MPEDIQIGIPLPGGGTIGVSLRELFDSFYPGFGRSKKTHRGVLQDRLRVSAQKHELDYHKWNRRVDGRLLVPESVQLATKYLNALKVKVPGTTVSYTKMRQVTPHAWRTVEGFKVLRRQLEAVRRAKRLFNPV